MGPKQREPTERTERSYDWNVLKQYPLHRGDNRGHEAMHLDRLLQLHGGVRLRRLHASPWNRKYLQCEASDSLG
jgi:hypothetical protein